MELFTVAKHVVCPPVAVSDDRLGVRASEARSDPECDRFNRGPSWSHTRPQPASFRCEGELDLVHAGEVSVVELKIDLDR